jgi:hypothetical protein
MCNNVKLPYLGDITVDQYSYLYDYTQSNSYNANDVIIEHHEYFCTYQYECGKSFIDICRDMGLDKNTTTNISI